MEDYIQYVDFFFRGRFYQFEEISFKVVLPGAWDPLDRIDVNYSKALVDGRPYNQEPGSEIMEQLANYCLDRIEDEDESDGGSNYSLF
jgi:hypothetical protein